MKSRPVLFSIPTSPYPGALIITTESSATKIIKYINTHYDGQIEQNDDTANGIYSFADAIDMLARATKFNAGRTLIQFHATPNLSTLAHELVHATYNTLNYAGVDLKDEEAFAYLFDYFLSEAISKMKVSLK